MTNYEKLEKVLTELFQLDKAELDFGIYRIMNQKREDVLDFLKNKLPKEVRTILEGQQKGDVAALKKDLDNAIKTAKEFGLDPDTTSKVQEAKVAYESAGSIEVLEQEVFSHLASFFKRYYEGGDFISLRRYKKDVYAIPYEGEEVKLHWANHDQYYIKTSENLKNYAFKIEGDKTVRFTLKEASTEQNNNKTQKDQGRRFALFIEDPVTIDGDTIHINFTYEPHKKTVKQDKLLEKAIEQLTDKVPTAFAKVFSLAPTEKSKNRTLLEKHLNDFSARNTFDYFIHKDLGGFLTRELDFYIKNEVLFIDDINTDNEQAFAVQLSKIRALKQVGSKIITFLAQLENFQKKLWLKKKFVVSCDYCITLDRIPESYYPEIVINKAQLEGWKTLFDVDIQSIVDLKEDPYLVLDTKFFSQDFKDKLLAEFDDLDEQTNGILINSDNFQALMTILNSFKDKVDICNIDPPYNTLKKDFTYKDGFMSSSWLSFMVDRLLLAKNLIKGSGILYSNIDENETYKFQSILENIFLKDNFICEFIWQNKKGGGNDSKFVATEHEYIKCFAKDKGQSESFFQGYTDDYLKRYKEEDNISKFYWDTFKRKSGKQYYPIKCPDGTIIEYDNLGNKVSWLRSEDRFKKDLEIGEIKFEKKTDGWSIFFKQRLPNGKKPRSILTKLGTTSDGNSEQLDLFAEILFSNPKPVNLVNELLSFPSRNNFILDYFAGSGTTGHATIKLNREDNGNRKYILVEMGEYFNTVTKPRIQKVIYTDNWKNGKPQDKNGISQMFKYFNLESYEDCLNNLQLKPNQAQQQLLDTNSDMQEEYLLQYMLDVETRDQLLNIEAFKNPFNYKLNITENNELVPATVDLVETFNYLIGLHVKRIERIRAFKTVIGVNNAGEKILVIWRNLEESTNDDLDKFVRKQEYKLRDGEFDTVYVNGDNNLANLKQEDENWKVLLLEEVFFTLMFDVKDV
jgi:adenine-specific DNA-methyltransferase